MITVKINESQYNMINEIINGLAAILGPIATLPKEKRELKDRALRAISNALYETYLYYRDLEKGSQKHDCLEA